MRARTALQILSEYIGETESFIETIDHEFHGDPEGECRFDFPLNEALSTLTDAIAQREEERGND